MRKNGGPCLPVEPFRAWLEWLIEEKETEGYPNPISIVARGLKMTDKQLREYRFAKRHANLYDVDAAITADGRWHVGDLYPSYWQEEEAAA